MSEVKCHWQRNACTERMVPKFNNATVGDDGVLRVPSVVQRVGGGFAGAQHDALTKVDQAQMFKAAHEPVLPFSWLLQDDDDAELETGSDGRDVPTSTPGSFLAKILEEKPAVERAPAEEELIKSVVSDLQLSAVAQWLLKRLRDNGDTLEGLIDFAKRGAATMGEKQNAEESIRSGYAELMKAQRVAA